MDKKSKVRVLISNTFDPYFNLATEDWIFQEMDPEINILYLWRNQETVVIGRFQNPWTECNLKKMEEDNVLLTRRQSGGGAVFHDLGNTNFTFLSSKENYSKELNNKIITEALEDFDINAYASGRNDILVDTKDGPRKISGSAFKEKKDRSFHHGTLLIEANLSKLGDYLNPSKKKLQSKGISSVKSRVENLSNLNSSINHDDLCKSIISKFFKNYGQECEIETLDENVLKKIPELVKYYEFLKDWDWRFGETPKFNHQLEERFSWGGVEVFIDSHKAKIENIKIYSDSLHPEMIELLMQKLNGQTYDSNGISKAIEDTISELPMISEYLIEFKEWMINQISL